MRGLQVIRRSWQAAVATLGLLTSMLVASPAQADVAPTFPARTAAGGESFVAGDGGVEFGAYLDSTDTPQNRCHRSNTSYPELLKTAGFINLVANTACSGATIDSFMTNGQYNEPAQVTRIPQGLRLYLLMIGGNDIGYGTVAGCILQADCTRTDIPAQSMRLIAGLGPRLDAVYAAVRKAAPTATIVVLLYPLILPRPDAKPGPLCPYLQPGEAKIGYDLTTQLNAVIKDRAKAHGIVAADPQPLYNGRDVCSLTTFFYPPGLGATFHPNVLGRTAFAWTSLTAYLNN